MKPRMESAGFILAATLWIVAILALAGAYITGWVGDSLDRGYVRRAKVEAFRTSEEARATALYWFSTRYMSHRGIELLSGIDLANATMRDPFSAPLRGSTYLALDDRPYRFGDVIIHLQDARGLLNLNTGSDADLYQLLGDNGVAAMDREPMIAKLHDYIEPGPFKRLNGAKARDYLAAGMQPPTGHKLQTPWELRHVMSWDKLDPDGFGRSPFYEATTTVVTAGLNLNTAPRQVIALLPGINDAGITRVITARQKKPFLSTADIEAQTGVAIPPLDLGYFFLPLNSVRISITVPGDPLERVMSIHLTPAAFEQPWQIDYVFDIPPFPDHKPTADSDTSELPDPTHPPSAT
jgi:general secretion pathway protein K